MPRREQIYCIVLLTGATVSAWIAYQVQAPVLGFVAGVIGAATFLHVLRDGRDLD